MSLVAAPEKESKIAFTYRHLKCYKSFFYQLYNAVFSLAWGIYRSHFTKIYSWRRQGYFHRNTWQVQYHSIALHLYKQYVANKRWCVRSRMLHRLHKGRVKTEGSCGDWQTHPLFVSVALGEFTWVKLRSCVCCFLKTQFASNEFYYVLVPVRHVGRPLYHHHHHHHCQATGRKPLLNDSSTLCNLELTPSIDSILSSPYGHPVTSYAFFLFFLPLLSAPLPFLQ